MQELIKEFEELANNDSTESIEKLKGYLLVREGDPYEKHTIPHLACRALLSKGIVGVQTLTEVLIDAPGVNYPIVILASLWQAGDGKFTSMIFANTYNSLILEKEMALLRNSMELNQEPTI
ncbi:hypothetical protein [Vibrio atlanticus]|uniref:Uncharacterized protein n=2 Tax=Vibrio atlanticus TaxID=693153 RepID=A0ABV4KPP6_9VIBR